MQLCKAQEIKIRLTSRNWQQELCQHFLAPPAPASNAASTASDSQDAEITGLQETALAAAGQDGTDGYWGLAPGVRLRMLRELCYAVLNTYIFR